MQALPALSTLVASTHSGMRGERLFFAGAGGGNASPGRKGWCMYGANDGGSLSTSFSRKIDRSTKRRGMAGTGVVSRLSSG